VHLWCAEAGGQRLVSQGMSLTSSDLSVLDAYVVKQAQDRLLGSFLFSSPKLKKNSIMLTALREICLVMGVEKLAN